MKAKVLKIHPSDNVLVALQPLVKGEVVTFEGVDYILQEDIPAKHKFFMQDMQHGDEIHMYGVLVGKAQYAIPQGGIMNTDNTKHAVDPYTFRPYHYHWTAPDVSKFEGRTFNGFVREDGRVGTANYWLFIPTVFCENRNLDVIKEALYEELGYSVTTKYKSFTHQLLKAYQDGEDLSALSEAKLTANPDTNNRVFKNVDGIKFLNHQGGCGGIRQDAAVLSKLLAAYADHPNVAGVTVLSLGCQNLQLKDLVEDIKARNPNFNKPLFVFEQQQSKSEEQLIKEAIQQTFAGLVEINKFERTPVPLSKMTLGVKCGGSDGFSGISANPAVGYTSDLLVA